VSPQIVVAMRHGARHEERRDRDANEDRQQDGLTVNEPGKPARITG
jgi:hypothetical protein